MKYRERLSSYPFITPGIMSTTNELGFLRQDSPASRDNYSIGYRMNNLNKTRLNNKIYNFVGVLEKQSKMEGNGVSVIPNSKYIAIFQGRGKFYNEIM